MFRFAFRFVLLVGFVVGSAAALAAAPPGETAAPMANAGWEEVGLGSASEGGITNATTQSYVPSLAAVPEDVPFVSEDEAVVAWSEVNFDAELGGEIYVKHWNGTQWVEMGTGSATGGGISATSSESWAPALDILDVGLAIVAWEERMAPTSDDEIYVRQWNGSTWTELGDNSASGEGVSNNNGTSRAPALTSTGDWTAILAWQDDSSGNNEIYVKRWNGSAWIEVGGASATGGGVSNNSGASQVPSLAVGPGGMPVIAWADDSSLNWEIYVRRWDGTAWTELGAGSASGRGISNTSGLSTNPSVAIGPDGMPVVAWEDSSDGDPQIYVRRWNGSAWVEMGSGSASGRGISGNGWANSYPSLAINRAGVTIMAWEWWVPWTDTSEVYVRRWDGFAWVEMEAGSATHPAGGISKSGYGEYPSVAITGDGRPMVAWQNDYRVDNGVNNEIYVRRGPALPCFTLSTAVVPSSGGALSAAPLPNCIGDSDRYTSGTEVTLTATPHNGYIFTGWSGDVTGDQPSKIVVMNGNKAVTANFSPSCYTLTTTSAPSPGGSISVAPPPNCAGGKYTVGTQVTLTATAGNGYTFTGWNGALTGVQSPASTLMNSDKTVVANFAGQSSTHQLFLPQIVYQQVAAFCWMGPDELEPNNAQAEANGSLCSGRVYFGLPNDRYDIFFFEAAAGPITINLANHTGGGVQLQLHHQAITPNPMAIDYSGADGYHIQKTNAPAGRYYIVISTATPNAGATQYTLTPTFTTSD